MSYGGEWSPRSVAIYRIGVKEYTAYKPRPFAGRLCFFRAAHCHPAACDPLPVWKRRAGRVEIYEIPGHHTAVMDLPAVEFLAHELSECLKNDESTRPQPGA